MIKKLGLAVLPLLMILYIVIPFSTSDLHIKINFAEVSGDKCNLYYATTESGGFLGTQLLTADIVDGQADFVLDAALCGKLTQLRFDWPNEVQTLCVKDVTVSSAGLNKKIYSKERFFSDATIENVNDVTGVYNELSGTYILTEASDPYCIMTPEFSGEIQKLYSHYRVSKAVWCLILGLAIMFRRRGPFSK